jgi:hypothetical protein
MSQNDFTIANQTFPNTRADINSALQALASTSSGGSAPSTTFANQFFYNTTSNLLQIRNEANDAFITIAELDQANDTVEYFKSDSIRTALIEFTDGDDALAIADGGALTTAGNLSIGGSNNELRFYEGANYVGFEAPALSADKIWVLPTADVSANQALVTNGSGTLSFADPTALRPNNKPLIINGDMQITTRGTSKTGITSTGIDVQDRFSRVMGGAGTWTQTSDADVPAGQGFNKSMKWDCTTAAGLSDAGQIFSVRYIWEGRDLQLLKYGHANAEKLTVAFWIKSPKTGTHIVSLYAHDDNRRVSKAYTVSSANTWEKHVCAFPADTTGVIDNDSGAGISLEIGLSAGATYTSGTLATSWASYVAANSFVGQVNCADNTANNVFITGVQVEVGEYTSATIPAFQHENVQDSQMRCSRYFQKMTAANNNFVGRGFSSDGGGRGATLIDTPCAMRAAPTITTSAASTFKFAIGTTSSGNGTGFIVKGYFNQAGMNNGQGFDSNQNFVIWLDISVSGMSDGAFTRGVSNGDSFVEVSAEI